MSYKAIRIHKKQKNIPCIKIKRASTSAANLQTALKFASSSLNLLITSDGVSECDLISASVSKIGFKNPRRAANVALSSSFVSAKDMTLYQQNNAIGWLNIGLIIEYLMLFARKQKQERLLRL